MKKFVKILISKFTKRKHHEKGSYNLRSLHDFNFN